MIARIPHSPGLTLEIVSEANPGWKVELEADGSITMCPTGTISGAHDVALLALLIEWNKRAGGQLFGSSTGFTMPDKSVLSPDAAWISAERWHAVPAKARAEYVLLVDPYRRTTWSKGVKPFGFPTEFTSVFDAGMI